MVSLILVLLFGAGCAHRPASETASVIAPDEALGRAIDAANHRRCDLAIRFADEGLRSMPVDDGATNYQATRIRSTAGALMALLQASQDPDSSSTVLTTPYWADLLYIKGFCQIETNDLAGAKRTFQRQLRLIPGDAPAACELGHMAQGRKDWQSAIELYATALGNATWLEEGGYGAESGGEPSLWGMTLRQWKGRALRGLGYSYVELRDLDRAEQAYKDALALDPDDAQALREIALIASMRAR